MAAATVQVPAPAAAAHRRRTALALAAAVVSGAVVALQQRVNGQLKLAVGDALVAALVSFSVGLLTVLVVLAFRPASLRRFPSVRTVPWWTRLGGLGGASLVAIGAAAAPRIGVALLTVGLVAGQTTGGVVVDRLGIGPGGSRGLTWPRVAGALLCLVAVGVSALGRGVRQASPLLLALVLVAGFLIALQQGLNGRVRVAVGDTGVATLLNFVVGTSALALGVLLRAALHGLTLRHLPGAGHWWLYLGGPMGAVFVAVAAVVVRELGVLRLGLAVVAGQLLGAVLLDATVPVHGEGLAGATVAGAALTLVAVAVSGRPARRPLP